jgi:peptide/nickel transport system permease protein
MSINESVQTVDKIEKTPIVQPQTSPIAATVQSIWKVLTINKKIAIGSCIVLFFILVAIIGPFMLPYNPMALSPVIKAPPSAAHWLGTANSGQDVFSQVIYGTRSSIFWGFLTGLLVMVISVTIGLIGGYFGGLLDELLTLLTNIFLLIPSLALAIIAVAYFPRTPLTIATVIISTNWCFNARILRAQTLSMRSREFVTAARACGESAWRIIFAEILPNEIGIVAAAFVSTVIFAILAWAALEFLGLGDPNSVSWGSMLYWASQSGAIFGGQWWWFLPPGLCIALVGVGLTLINIGIDEVIDPRLRTSQ